MAEEAFWAAVCGFAVIGFAVAAVIAFSVWLADIQDDRREQREIELHNKMIRDDLAAERKAREERKNRA